MSGSLDALLTHFRIDFWALVGLVGQAIFFTRFLVQWRESEKRGESFVPVAFWYFSIAGGLITLVYTIRIGSLPLTVGQVVGLFVYFRNLHLIRRKSRAATPVAD